MSNEHMIAQLQHGYDHIKAGRTDAGLGLIASVIARMEGGSADRDRIARVVALHGLGTVSGMGHRGPPNSAWTKEEWERRILECVPYRVEQQSYELADAILAMQTPHVYRRTPEDTADDSLLAK